MLADDSASGILVRSWINPTKLFDCIHWIGLSTNCDITTVSLPPQEHQISLLVFRLKGKQLRSAAHRLRIGEREMVQNQGVRVPLSLQHGQHLETRLDSRADHILFLSIVMNCLD